MACVRSVKRQVEAARWLRLLKSDRNNSWPIVQIGLRFPFGAGSELLSSIWGRLGIAIPQTGFTTEQHKDGYCSHDPVIVHAIVVNLSHRRPPQVVALEQRGSMWHRLHRVSARES